MNSLAETKQTKHHERQRFFVEREIQLTIASLVVIAMLGTLLVHYLSMELVGRLGFKTPMLAFFLVVGYISVVFIITVCYSHRLVGPFKRLEREMRLFKSSSLPIKKLSVRGSDDIYVRNFVREVNAFLSKVEEDVEE